MIMRINQTVENPRAFQNSVHPKSRIVKYHGYRSRVQNAQYVNCPIAYTNVQHFAVSQYRQDTMKPKNINYASIAWEVMPVDLAYWEVVENAIRNITRCYTIALLLNLITKSQIETKMPKLRTLPSKGRPCKRVAPRSANMKFYYRLR